MAIFPVTAPVGTVAVTWVSEWTVNVASFPSNVTLVGCVKLTPVIVTTVPTGPLGGLKLLICGETRNFGVLVSVTPEVVTVTKPVVAPAGTLALTSV